MKRLAMAMMAATFVLGTSARLCADAESDAKAVVEKAVAAMGGAEKLGRVKGAAWKAKGSLSFGDNDSPFSSQTTINGPSHYRMTFEAKGGGGELKGNIVVAGDKAWRKFGDMSMDLSGDDLAAEKRFAYFAWIPMVPSTLLEKGYKLKLSGEEKLDGKAALAVSVTPSDGKEFTLYFDKSTSLPVKLVGRVDFLGNDSEQEIHFLEYKELGGIKRAVKLKTLLNGNKFLDQEISDFKLLDKVDPKTFEQPD